MTDGEIDRLYDRLRGRAPIDLSPDQVTFVSEEDLNPGFLDRPLRKGRRPASVLVPLVDRADDLTVLLTQRTDHLPDHAGQVSFPGGSREVHDTDDIETALRETEEEVGIGREYIDVIGRLADYRTGTGFDVTPIIGVVRSDFTLDVDQTEVADVFEVPLRFFLDRSNHQTEARKFSGINFNYYAMPYDGFLIWGATAAMLVNLSRVLAVYARVGASKGSS